MKQSVPVGSEQQAKQSQPAADMAHAADSPGFVDNRPETITIRQLKDTIRSSPKMIAQRNIGKMLHNSSREVTQRELYRSTKQLKASINSRSSMSDDHAKVHSPSSRTTPLSVHDYVQEGGMPTAQMKDGVPVNDDFGLETETDVMKNGMQFRAAGKGDAGAVKADLAAYSTNGQMTIFRKSLPISFGAPGLQATAQLATEIKHTPGTVPFAGKNYMVGKKMIAKLDPNDPVKGSATTYDNYDWMKGIRAYYGAAGVIRGHLLNHDLGGYGVPENLYPISSMANSQHSDRVEQKVKGALSDSASNTKNEIEYSVDVNEKGPGDMPYENAEFVCKWSDENGTVYNDVISSELNKDKGWGGKSAKALKSPSKWRHGSRRGDEDMAGVIANNKIMIDKGPLGMTAPDYNKLRSDTTKSKGIDVFQDVEEAKKMFASELDELALATDPNNPPKPLKDGIALYEWLLITADQVANDPKKTEEFISEHSGQLMKNFIAIRKARIYFQEGIDTESNIADESDEIEPMEL